MAKKKMPFRRQKPQVNPDFQFRLGGHLPENQRKRFVCGNGGGRSRGEQQDYKRGNK